MIALLFILVIVLHSSWEAHRIDLLEDDLARLRRQLEIR